jgi:hypothetical protein
MKRPADRRINWIKGLRLDAVHAVVAELDAEKRVRPLDVKLEQQFTRRFHAGDSMVVSAWTTASDAHDAWVAHRTGRPSALA